MGERQDRRVARTRGRLIEAFNHLLLQRRRRPIRVADIVAEAKVGRSTFYDHYSGPEAIHLEAMARPFALLADAAAGIGDPERLAFLLRHFWENRQRARDSFGGRFGEKTSRLLADLVEERLAARRIETRIARRIAAVQLAEAALAPVRAWVAGEAPCAAETLADSLCRTGAQLAAALSACAAQSTGT
jgi:AcrR family transcriptional regulator